MINPSHQLKAAPAEIIVRYYGEQLAAIFQEIEQRYYQRILEFVTIYKESERRLYEMLKQD